MDFKDYYRTLGVDARASPEVIKRAYRKLARKYHPDVSQEPDAVDHFKEVAEAHEALIDPERRAAYDQLAARHALAQRVQARSQDRARGRGFDAQAASASRGARRSNGQADPAQDFGAFFSSLFGQPGSAPGSAGGPWMAGADPDTTRPDTRGTDHHARLEVALEDLYRGTQHRIALRRSELDAQGRPVLRERQVDVSIPKGMRPGQQLRLAGQGDAGSGGAAAGDLYLEIALQAQSRFRVDGADVGVDLPLSPWEAALGATVNAPTPEGEVALQVPAATASGRRLRLKGRGLPGTPSGSTATDAGTPAGDLYVTVRIVLPPADTDASRAAFAAFALAFPGFDPRAGVKG